MRKIGLRGFTLSALATSLSAATASNLYSASISETSYLRSRSEKMGSTFRLLQSGVYYDEGGRPMPGSTLMRDPKFQDRVVAEARLAVDDPKMKRGCWGPLGLVLISRLVRSFTGDSGWVTGKPEVIPR
jgi:hypothetical protein